MDNAVRNTDTWKHVHFHLYALRTMHDGHGDFRPKCFVEAYRFMAFY